MKLNEQLPEVFRKSTVVALLVGLALGMAGGRMLDSNAQSTGAQSGASGIEPQGIPVPVHSSKAVRPRALDDLDAAINKLRSSAAQLSLPSSISEPWWRTMLHDPDAGWILRHFDLMSSDLKRPWALPIGTSLGTSIFIPRVDTTADKDKITVTAEVPGIDEKNLDVTVTNDTVTIKGEKKAEVVQKEPGRGAPVEAIERAYGSFERSIALPYKVDSEKAQASLKNGVLTVVVPRSIAAESEGKKLSIKHE